MRVEFWKRVPMRDGAFYFASVRVGGKRYNVSAAIAGEHSGGFSVKREGGVNEIAFGSLVRRGIELFVTECMKEAEAGETWEGVRATPLAFEAGEGEAS